MAHALPGCEFFYFPILKQYIVVGVARMVETYTWVGPDQNRYLLLQHVSGSILCGIKFVATLNISELHRHPKCAVTNTINKFGEIVSSL